MSHIGAGIMELKRQKEIKKDDNGYYEICLGGVNIFNSSGEFYLKDGVEDLLKDTKNPLCRKLANGNLLGEAGHPTRNRGDTAEDFFSRTTRVDLTRVSHHIKNVYLKETTMPSGLPSKGNAIAIMGWVKPIGKLGETLQDSLENKDQNSCFSIRCLTDITREGGIIFKKIVSIITWDWVVDPGIHIANKFHTESMESSFSSPPLEVLNNYEYNILNKRAIGEDDKENLNYIRYLKKQIATEDAIYKSLTKW